MIPDPYVVLAGHGKSGSHWLLWTLDLSPMTYCRNDVNRVPASPFRDLPHPWARVDESVDIGEAWDAAVDWCRTRIGIGDPMPRVAKAYAAHQRRERWVRWLFWHSSVRRVAHIFIPSLGPPDAIIPEWCTGRIHRDKARLVMKITGNAWMPWVIRNRPQATILHIVRHPAGRLDNWQDRLFLKAKSQEAMAQANRQRLRKIAHHDQRWAATFGDIDAMSAKEAEVWCWRYASESIYKAGCTSPQYHLVVYEDFAQRPVAVAQSVFEACGLEWTDRIRETVRRDSTDPEQLVRAFRDKLEPHDIELCRQQGSLTPNRLARLWREKLDPSDIELCERVLHGSFMAAWWDGQGRATPPARPEE